MVFFFITMRTILEHDEQSPSQTETKVSDVVLQVIDFSIALRSELLYLVPI